MTLAEAISILRGSKKNFTHLDLRDKQIGDEGVDALEAAVKYNYASYVTEVVTSKYPIQCIDLSGNDLSLQGIKSLARIIGVLIHKNHAILSLSLNNIGLDDEGLDLLLDCFIEYYSPVPEEVGQVPKCIAPARLSLDGNRIGPMGAKRLANMLAQYGAIRYLSLNHNALGDEGAKAVGFALSYNVGLKNLSLSHNEIGDEGMRAVTLGLNDNITLNELDLSYNRCSDIGASAFASLFSQNVGLSKVNLQNNMIADEGVSKMGLALLENVTLELIELKGNQLSPKGIEEFALITKNLSDVKTLKQVICGISSASSSTESAQDALPIEFEAPVALKKVAMIHYRGGKISQLNNYSEEPTSLVPLSMCVAGLSLQNITYVPTKRQKLEIKGGSPINEQYLWTAFMVLGEKLPHMKFGHEAIYSHNFNPTKEVGALWRRFAMDSLYERVFKHHLRPYMLDIVAFPKRYIAELETQEDIIWLEEYQRRLLQIRPLVESRRQETDAWRKRIKQSLVNQLHDNLPGTNLSAPPAEEKKTVPNKDIFYAARTGKIAIARRLLKQGVNPNHANEDGEIPVFLAAHGGHIRMMELLVAHGARLDVTDEMGDSILYYAILGGHVTMLDWALQHGRHANEVDKDGHPILFKAIFLDREDMVSCLLTHGANVNYDCGGITPLRFAQNSSKTSIVACLLKHGAHDSVTSVSTSTFASSSSSSSSTGVSDYPWVGAPQLPFHASSASQSSATSSSGISSPSFSADYASSYFYSTPSAPPFGGYNTSSVSYQPLSPSFGSSIGAYGSHGAGIPPASYYSDYYAVPASSSTGGVIPLSSSSSFDILGNQPNVYTTPGIPHFFSGPPLYADTRASASTLPPVSSAPEDDLFDAPPKKPTDSSKLSSTESDEHVISFLEQGANVGHQETSTSSGFSTTYAPGLFTSQAEVQTPVSVPEKTMPEIPAFLTCPITATGELMEDPVSTTGTGQTYERAAIALWLTTHDTDPMTRQVLIDKNLTPNIGIRQAIEHFRKTNKDSGLRM